MSLPIYSYPDEVARKWKQERDAFENALKEIARQVTWPDHDNPKIKLTYALGTIEAARRVLAEQEGSRGGTNDS